MTAFGANSDALPSDFSGTYKILQSRTLGLTNGRGYVLQDGLLVAEADVDLARVYCRAGQSKFDEVSGSIDVTFNTAVDGSEHAILKTVPGTPVASPTIVECTANNGFLGTLDISIALGRVFELAK